MNSMVFSSIFIQFTNWIRKKPHKGSRVNLHVLIRRLYFKKKKTQTQCLKGKKTIKIQRDAIIFFLNPLLSLEDPPFLKFAGITLSYSFYPQSQRIQIPSAYRRTCSDSTCSENFHLGDVPPKPQNLQTLSADAKNKLLENFPKFY